ncbi:MAG: bifunctional diguanylate cyclase/phosphodiesterase, partial [Treponema sp.]|nr:bifunctional diguanylate cyclase/phosphodiesterase [Treponema sp.]
MLSKSAAFGVFMCIKKLNQLYKPRRILYYIIPSKEEINAFYKGILPETIKPFENAFGAYDSPGLFFARDIENDVIGIEFRINDPRIHYPTHLKSLELEEHYFYSIELDEETHITEDFIKTIFTSIAKDDDAHRRFSDLSVLEDPNIIGVFTEFKKYRVLYESKIENDDAKHVMNEREELLDKKKLFRLAFFDPITGHYNWNHLVSYLEMPKNKGISDYAFAHFDVKDFRVINEVYGHSVANKLLCQIVDAMKKADFIYTSSRCHEDNFAIMIKDMPEEETINKLKQFFAGISHLDEDPNYTIFYRCGFVPMQKAMLLGNRVPDAGKLAQSFGQNHNETQIITYTDKMHNDISWGNYIKTYVATAIANDEFVVYLQPKFDISKEVIKGAEALIRWNYKNKEFLLPERFIPFFEKDGSIGKIDDIVLKKVCQALARWKKEGKPLYPISINLSRNRMYNKNLISNLSDIVDKYGIDHRLIDFELTESAGYNDTGHMISVLKELRSSGYKISMDDFGTGYSSFSLLTKMPLDTLKIDKSFVDNLALSCEHKEDIVVVKHIINLAKELGFTCLAEGAERKPQVDCLRELGC